MEAATNSVVSTKRNRKYLGLACGSFLIGFTLFSIMFFPLISDKTGYEILMGYLNESKDVGDEQITPEPYIWVTHDYNGGIGRWEVNETFYRSWLNSTVIWKVEKSFDGSKWSSYDKFEVKKVWDSVNLSEKHTIIVTSDEDAFYRILSNTKSDKQLIGYDDLSSKSIENGKSNDYVLSFKVSDDKNYDLKYNWDDYLNSDTASKSSFTKNVKIEPTSNKQFFEFTVVSNVKIAKGETFVLDPIYGVIYDSTIDSWNYDTSTGWILNGMDSLTRISTSEYYVTTASRGADTDYDGYLSTFRVYNSNGSISKTVISTWEYDTSDGLYAGIIPISGNVYAVYYCDAAAGVLFTTTIWSNNGTLKKDTLDTESYTFPHTSQLIHVTGNIYALIYQEGGGGFDYFLETYNISNAGVISARIDVVEWDQTSTAAARDWHPQCTMVDSDTIAIVWTESVGSDGWLTTYNISAAGDITNTLSDVVEFDTTYGKYPYIYHITNNIFAITYVDTDSDGWTKTCTITNAGNIAESPEGTITWVDTLEWANTNTVAFPVMFKVLDTTYNTNGIFGVTYQDSSGDGQLCTMLINETGIIGNAIIDSIEFDTTDSMYYAPVLQVNDEYFLVIYTDTGAMGSMCTIDISNKYNVDALTSGSGTWTVPAGVNRISVLVVGGGGGGGKAGATNTMDGGGGGAGGLVFVENVSSIGVVAISPGNTISYSVGAGGAGSTTANVKGANGTMSTFGNLTAAGGGGAGSVNDAVSRVGVTGGSGGGGACNAGSYGAGGTTNQSSLSGWSGSHGFGYNGANAASNDGGGGGGAGGAASGKTGGIGKDYSSFFGKFYGVLGVFSKGGGSAAIGAIGVANSGNGGDGNNGGSSTNGYAGGSGIILIKYIYVATNTTEFRLNQNWNGTLYNVTDFNTIFTWNGSLYNNTLVEVITNESTGVSCTNTTLNGFLSDDNGEDCTVRFQFGLTTDYGNTTLNQTKSIGQTFSDNLIYNDTSINSISNKGTYTKIKEKQVFYDGIVSIDWQYRGYDGSPQNVYTQMWVNGVPIGTEFEHLRDGDWRQVSNQEVTVNAGDYVQIYGKQQFAGANVNVAVRYFDISYPLEEDTTYHYRAVANNSYGVFYGQDKSFTTLICLEWYIVSTWNGSIFNSTSWIASAWNGSIYNGSSWNQDSIWNGTIYNTTDFRLNQNWNGTIFNSSVKAWNIINNWNGSIYNSSSWFVSVWNGSLFNGTVNWQTKQTWNGTLYNSNNWITTTWNGSIFNSTSWIASAWNGSIYNGSSWNQDSIWNGTIYNTTDFRLNQNWNGTLYNKGSWITQIWNGTLFNGTGLGPTFNITITNIYPGNNSININVQPTLYFTVNNTLGNIMNISWYYGITPSNMFLLGNTTNIFNSTVSKLDFNASHSSTHYYWRVFITDGTNSINKSFSFRTVGISNIIFNPGQGSAGIIGIIGIIGLLGFIFGMRQRRKKKHEVIRETIRFYRR